jgi:hypothetical protein
VKYHSAPAPEVTVGPTRFYRSSSYGTASRGSDDGWGTEENIMRMAVEKLNEIVDGARQS